jgi:hypothetical protein
MLSNIITLFLKSSPHFLFPVPQTHPTTLFAFLTISLICALSVALSLNLEPKYLNSFTCTIFLPSQLHSFSTLFFFLFLNTIIFVLSTFTSSFFFLTYFPRFFIISFISLSLFLIITKSFPNTRLQNYPPLVIFIIYNHSPSFSLTFTLRFALAYISLIFVPAIRLFLCPPCQDFFFISLFGM